MSVEAGAAGVRTGAGGRLVGRLFTRAAVAEVGHITPRMRRIRLAGPALAGLPCAPGQQLRVLVSPLFAASTLRTGFRDALRTYSVWDRDPATATIDLCVLDHGDGPGARWARTVAAGDEVAFTGPEGKFTLREARYHVFIGEETAQAAFGAMLRALPASDPVYGAIEVDSESDRLPLPRAGELTWRERHGAPATESPSLLEAVRGLQLPDQPGFAYLAGEAKTCAAVRRHLRDERGWPARACIAVKPFWAPGKRGLE